MTTSPSSETPVKCHPGATMLPLLLLLLFGSIAAFIYFIAHTSEYSSPGLVVFPILACVVVFIISIILLTGLFTLQPNEARVLILFGKYKGTVRDSGFYWGNPFYSNHSRSEAAAMASRAAAASHGESQKSAASAAYSGAKSSRFRISLRVRNMLSDRLKVNDNRGNPIEIAAVIVWRVHNTAQACFDVDDYENYVRIQSESAIRHLASNYAYDNGEQNETTLRGGSDEVADALRAELQVRLAKAGVTVDEARITHLAYAPEIAQAMLRRQQAEAVIAARAKIVHGAVTMVDMALKELAEKHVVTLDDERKAAMVSNLMVVLCGEAEVHPVINTGTLYN